MYLPFYHFWSWTPFSREEHLVSSALLLLLLSRFSRVRLSVIPLTEAHLAPASLGFSRQEHWSGLPFPSPMHESEKWKGSHSVVSDSLQPHALPAYQAPPSMGFSRQEYWSGVPLPSPIIYLSHPLKPHHWISTNSDPGNTSTSPDWRTPLILKNIYPF